MRGQVHLVHLPGGDPPHTPPETFNSEAGPEGSGFHFFNRGQAPAWDPYQSQVTGLVPDEHGRIPEWMQYDPDTGKFVAFDTRTHRGDTEVFIDAKHGYQALYYNQDKIPDGMIRNIVSEARRQQSAVPEDAVLEWHVSSPEGAAALHHILDKELKDRMRIQVIYTPEGSE